jgi:hypothetical protein
MASTEAVFSLCFHRWHRQARTLFSLLRYKVLLAIDNIMTHLWSAKIVLTIIGTICLSFELAPGSVNRADLSRFLIVVWAIHHGLIPNEVG